MIDSEADIARELEKLVLLDARLAKVVDIAGDVPLRRTAPGLRGLIGTVVGQQVSRASAEAIFGRFARLVDLDDPMAILAADPTVLREAGLSAAKQRTALALAEAVRDARIDLDRIDRLSPGAAIAELTALPGIGVWTAECYLLFAAGHSDVFPAGDLALQVAVAHAFALPERPKEKSLALLGARWSPHRSVAARLFWSYYHAVTRRDAAPAQAVADGAGDPTSRPETTRKRRGAEGFTKATR